MESTNVDALLANAVIIDLRIQSDEERAQKLLRNIQMQLSEQDWDCLIEFMTSEISYRLVTEENSPVLAAVRDVYALIKELNRDSFEERNDLISALGEVIETQNATIDDLKKDLAIAVSENNSLKNALGRVRKYLKDSEIKQAITFCNGLSRQNVVGEIGQVAVSLADAVKSACIAIKGV